MFQLKRNDLKILRDSIEIIYHTIYRVVVDNYSTENTNVENKMERIVRTCV